MAMEATHIRFARDLAEHLDVQNLNDYFAGAVYPDSRYVTGLERDETHSQSSDPFDSRLSDFQKGWATHLLYDELAGGRQRSLIPAELQEGERQNEWWVFFSAIKLIEDIQSYEALSEQTAIFQTLSIKGPPMGEDAKLLQKYYKAQATLYARKPNAAAYRDLFKTMGLDTSMADAMERSVTRIRKDQEMIDAIQTTYDSTLKEVLKQKI